MNTPTSHTPPAYNNAPSERAALQVSIHWLATSQRLDSSSLALLVTSFFFVLWKTPTPYATAWLAVLLLGVGVFAGLMQKVLAVRIAFDVCVFQTWLRHLETRPEQALEGELSQFDAALIQLGLRRSTQEKTLRTLHDRLLGAHRLYRQQAYCLAMQCVALVGVCCIFWF